MEKPTIIIPNMKSDQIEINIADIIESEQGESLKDFEDIKESQNNLIIQS